MQRYYSIEEKMQFYSQSIVYSSNENSGSLKNKIYVGEIWTSWRSGHDGESIITDNKWYEQSMF